jgi:uncharacterized protein (DUF58 family)
VSRPVLPSSEFLQRLERLSLVARRTLRSQRSGDRRSKRHGGTVEFADFRPYAWGDDVRRIDWHAFARFESLFLKLFSEEQDLSVHVLLDASPSMRTGEPEKLRYAAELAAALGYVALAGSDRLTVRAFVGGEAQVAFGPARGRAQLARLLLHLERTLAREAGGETSIGAAVNAFLAHRPEPGIVLVVSDFLDRASGRDGVEGAIARLHVAHEPFLLHVASKDEVEPTPGEELELVDAETGESVAVTLDRTAVRAYAERFKAFVGRLESLARRLELPYALVRTDVPLEELVLELIRRRAVARGAGGGAAPGRS